MTYTGCAATRYSKLSTGADTRHVAWIALATTLLMVMNGSSAYAQLSVSESGAPSYSQAIAVPPGVAGMAPKIGLFYAGGGVNGPVGHGWSIQGISIITRCPAIKAIDGVKGNVTFTAADKLCLDGQRLIQTDANGTVAPSQTNDALGIVGAATPREYRTEKDTYARIRAYGNTNGDATGSKGPAYFKVWTKSGQIYEYGASPSADANTKALISPYQQTVAAVWAVSRISDTLGNFIDFKYEQRDVSWGSGLAATDLGHEWNLIEIQYGSNKVIFNYTDRLDNAVGTMQDRAEAWHQGSKNVSVRLLQSITTYINSPNPTALGAAAGAVPVKTTQIGYGIGAISGRSRVQSIKECAGSVSSVKCLPATTFNYADGGSEAYQANANFASSTLTTLPMISTSNTYSVLTGDFNGDAKTDFLRLGDTPTDNQLWLSRGDGTFNHIPEGASAGQFNLNTQKLFSSDGCYSSVVADFNGDGIADVLRTVQATNNSGGSCPTTDTNVLFIGNGDGSFQAPRALTGIDLSSVKEVYTSSVSNCVLASLPLRDGDILAMADIPDMDVALTFGGRCYNYRKSIGKNFYVLDVNGDGIPDIVTTVNPAYYVSYASGDSVPTPDQACTAPIICTHVYLGSASGAFTELTSTNLANHSVYADPPAGRAGLFKPNVVDVDGDGQSDLSVGKNGVWRSNGDGNFTLLSGYGSTCVTPIDFNGDGRADCLISSAAGASSNSLYASNGIASATTPRFNLTHIGQELTTPTGSALALGSMVVDINGDGRSDVLRWADDPTKNTVYLSNGDGSFTTSTSFNLTGTDYQLKKGDGSVEFIVGDFTGHGTTEILRMVASPVAGTATSNQLYTKTDVTPPDQLVSVTSGSGAITTLYYVPLTNPTPSNGVSGSYGARYTSDRSTSVAPNPNAAVFPQVDVSYPMYVVASSQADSGVGSAKVVTEYSYLGLKADLTGRGLLGFREVRRQGPGPDLNASALSVFTQYLQKHPYIGAASRSDTRLSTVNNTSAQLLSTTTNAYCDLTSQTADYNAALTAAQADQMNVFCPTIAKVQRPYLLWTKETGADLGGSTLPTITTQNTFLPSGDPGTILVTTKGNVAGAPQIFTKTTTNAYVLDNTGADYWVLGRLSSARVQSTVPNVLPSLSTTAGFAPYAAATKGAAPLPPLTAAQLMSVFQLLLDD